MDNFTVIYGGLAALILFLIGFGYTIREFKNMQDERETGETYSEENAQIKE